MAIIRTTTKPTPDSKNRYSGQDSVPWVVKGSEGKPVVFEKDGKAPAQFTEYNQADGAARAYTAKTGLFAQAVRT